MSSASNSIAVTDASIEEVNVLLANAETDYLRYKNLYDQAAVTKQQYDNVRTQYESLKAKVETMKRQRTGTGLTRDEHSIRIAQQDAAIEAAQAALNLARLNMSYCTVIAPCNGATSRKIVQEGERSLTMNDMHMFGQTVLIGLTFYFPLAFRLKFRFTNRTSLTASALGLAVINAVFPYVHSYVLMLLLCYLGGFFRLYGTFECFSNLLPKITPSYNYSVFLTFVFFVVLGCVHLIDWVAIQVIYYYDWQHVHLLAIALCLSVAVTVNITMRHFRPVPKMRLLGIDGFGIILWSLFIFGGHLCCLVRRTIRLDC